MSLPITPLAWLLVLLSLAAMVPWARWLLHRAEGRAMLPAHNPMLLVLTTLGLSIGTLSLVMLWIGLLGLRLDWRLAAGIYLLVSLSGFLLRDRPWLFKDTPLVAVPPQPLQKIATAAWVAIAAICALIIFNAVFWPFGIDDAITIYASFGKTIATTGQLPTGPLYETYPMLIPLNYAFVFQLSGFPLSGWANEYLAALFPALLSIGVVGVAYQLGRELHNRAAGLIAALLIVLTPVFTHWASSGYVDLPSGFYFGMAALFLMRLDRTRSWADALLAGIMAGLAAWTKNSALLLLPSIALWIAYRWWLSRRDRQCRFLKFSHVTLIAISCLAVAGPWYARNVAVAGVIVPPTGWTWKAERTLANLFPYLTDDHYGMFGLVFTVGLLFTLWQVWKSRALDRQSTFLAIFTVPFFAIWWALFSYDVRFLLVLTPLVAVMGATGIQALWCYAPAQQRLMWMPLGIFFIALFALPAAVAAVDYKFDLLRHPFMSDADKHRLRIGADRYDMALYLKTLPAGSRIWTQDLLLPFNADPAQQGLQIVVGGWPEKGQLASYDYWVLSPGETLPDWVGADSPVHTQGGYRVYKVLR